METKLTKGNSSHYLVTVTVTPEQQEDFHKRAVQVFQKDVKVQGFRQGHVPLHMVEQQIRPEYLQMAIIEEIINDSIKYIIKEHADIQFIGQPYEINEGDKDATKDSKKDRIITYKLDTYPDVEVKNDNWKKLTIDAVDSTIAKEDIDQAINNLQRQYAEYKDTDTVAKNCLVKGTYSMVDKDGKELHKGTAFLGEEEYNESDLLWKAVEGKKKGDVVEFPYEEEKLPHAVHYHPHGSELAKQITKVMLTLVDTKEMILPDMHNEEVLTKLFQSPDIKTYDALVQKVKDVLVEQKEETGLQGAVEKVLNEAKNSLDIIVPETFLREELSARVKQLGDKLGGEEGLRQYTTQLGEEKTQQMYDEMRVSAKESLEKFFILRKLVELLEIKDINWENHLEAERKLYGKLSGSDTKNEPKAKKTKKDDKSDEA